MLYFVNQHDLKNVDLGNCNNYVKKDQACYKLWHKSLLAFNETVLTGENNQKACIHFLKSEAALFLDLVQNASKLDLKDPGNSNCCSTTVSPTRG